MCISSRLSFTLQSVSSSYPKAGSIVGSVLWSDHEGKLGLSVLCRLFVRTAANVAFHRLGGTDAAY